MQKRSWSSLELSFSKRGYAHADAVRRFIEQATRCLNPLALILFGSLARGDYHQHCDADFCVVLAASPPTPCAGYDQVAALDASGVVQPLVYGAEQFRRMIREPNGLALEVMADGIFLAGDGAFRQEVEELSAGTAQELGIERTRRGCPPHWLPRRETLTGGAPQRQAPHPGAGRRGWRFSRTVPAWPRADGSAAC